MTRALTTLALLITLAIPACKPEPAPPPEPQPAIEVSSAADDARIELALAATRTAITTLDRLEVTITLRRPVAERVTLIEPDWEAAGWARIDATDTAPRAITADRIERRRTVTIEPFLPGDYTVPPATIEWTDADARTRSLQTPPLDIAVSSVLAEADGPDLAAPVTAMPMPPEPTQSAAPSLLISIAVLAAALILWRVARRPAHHDEPRTPAETIRAIAEAEITGEQALPELHRALSATTAANTARAKDPRLLELIKRCELARFGPANTDTANARELARSALPLIGGAA